jgi:hypothetical protein
VRRSRGTSFTSYIETEKLSALSKPLFLTLTLNSALLSMSANFVFEKNSVIPTSYFLGETEFGLPGVPPGIIEFFQSESFS